MKKLKLFISLLFTVFSAAVFAQAEFEKIAITQNTQDNLAGRLIVQDATTGELKYILKSVLDNKFNQPTGNATQYLDGAGNPTAFPVLGQADRVIAEVRNTTGSTILKGTVVYLSGASGGKPTVQRAQANAEATSSGTFGVIQSDINNNSNGYVVVIGTVLGVNTSSYIEGQVLWLSPTVAGGFTTTKPVAPNHAVYVGIVTLAATQGTIEVKIQNGYELDEIHDVLITSKTDNDGLIYESSSGLWKNKQITKAMVGLANVDNTSDLNKPISTATQTALNLKENTANKNTANGYAGLGSDGKLISSQLPAITITDTFVVGSQAAMLALTAETGDVAVRTDVNKSFILKGTSAGTLADWQELLTPTSLVTSVFGRQGAVTANNGDYTTALVTETTNKRYQTDIQQTYNDATSSIQTQLDSKESLSNKSTSVTLGTSNTLYPTQNAVKTYVDGKVGGGDFANVVYVNSTDPNSASIFDLNNPPVTNNNALKADVGNLYVADNNSTWTYKTSPAGYYTYTVTSSSSNFFLTGTNIDAGSNKTSEIQRSGAIKATAFKTTNGTANQFVKGDGTLDTSLYPKIQMSNGYIPSYNSAFNTLANSNIWTNGTFTGIGVSTGLNRILQVVGTTPISHKHTSSPLEMLIGQFDSSGNSVINNTANADLYFHTNNTRAISIKPTSRVGIGTSFPAARLQVMETGGSGSNTNCALFSDSVANTLGISNANGVNTIFSQSLASTPLASDLAFATTTNAINGTPAERMRITSAGRVGIGTASPNGIFEVRDTTNRLLVNSDNGVFTIGSTSGGFYVNNVNNVASLFTILNNGNVGINTTSPEAGWRLDVAGIVAMGSTSGNGRLYISTENTTNGITYLQARNLSVATPLFYTASSHTFDTNVKVNTLGTGLVYSNGGILTSTNPSDSRLKEDITDLQYGLNEILKLRPVFYNWKDDKINQGKQFGFIAQEVKEVMPELVKEFKTEEGERLGLDKEGIYAALVNAIKEQQAQIKELQKEIEILKNK